MDELYTEPIDTQDDDLFASPPPAWPKWIGGLAIAWAGLMLTCTGLLSAYVLYLPKLVGPALDGAPMPEAMVLGVLDWTLMGVGFVFLVLLLFGGIFCVMRHPMSRWMILAWGIVSIPMSLVNYIRQMDAQESMQAWAQQYPDTQLAQQLTAGGQTGQQVGAIISLLMTIFLGILVPAFFVVWFGFIKTKPEQMTGSEDGVV